MQEKAQQDWVVSVAVPRPFDQTFDYLVPEKFLEKAVPGNWATVSFGRAKTHAYLVASPRKREALTQENFALKPLLEVGSSGAVIPAEVLKLCQWAADYYCAPLGELLQAAMPASALGLRTKREARSIKSLPITSSKGPTVVLTDDQKRAVDTLWALGGTRPGVLRGITGSGKTEVYLELARRTLAKGQSVILLVPEIALTSQLHQRIQEGLGQPVALWHSAVANGIRRDLTEGIRLGKVKAIVGARSAVFAPVQNLGLIIVDEEHDGTYKQEDRVRYHARDLAVVRAKMSGSLIVLGSATVSLETQERVREGRYAEAVLPNRIGASGAPSVEIISLTEEPRVDGIQAPLAVRSLEAIRAELDVGNQVIVFLNRRGFSASLVCEDCGEVSNCEDCSVSLTLHKFKKVLRCHLCGHEERIPDLCQKCQSMNLKPLGAGTESLEEQLPALLPGARVARLDRDVVTSATRLDRILDGFRRGETNLLLGTQMLAKGHDFPNVTLVLVILADGLFRFPDFRSAERGYQLLKQVIGRAGRADRKGRAIIQTYADEHPVLQALTEQITESTFYETERDLRLILHYPPFGRLVRFRVVHADSGICRRQITELAQALSESLRQNPGAQTEILGPSEAFIERVQGKFRFDLLIKSARVEFIQRMTRLAKQLSREKGWELIADIDPVGMG